MDDVSVVVTVKNEEKNIDNLIESLRCQKVHPKQIIFVDGGSSDHTPHLIYKYARRDSRVKLIIAPGANRSKGRNIGVRSNSTPYIACTDAGVLLDEHWLENLVKHFDNGADVVAGNYLPKCKNLLQECISKLVFGETEFEKMGEDFLPSSRSIAFKKSAWEDVGGYPEDLEQTEDTSFDLRLRQKGYKFALAPDAVAYWELRSDICSFFKQYFNYAYHETKSGLVFQLGKYRSSQVSNSVLNYFQAMRSTYMKTRKMLSFLTVSLVLTTFMLSLFSGFFLGWLNHVEKKVIQFLAITK